MITPSALNVLIIGASMLIFGFIWRWASAQLSETSIGKAMSTIY